MWPNNRRHNHLFSCVFGWVEGSGSTYLVAQLTPLSPTHCLILWSLDLKLVELPCLYCIMTCRWINTQPGIQQFSNLYCMLLSRHVWLNMTFHFISNRLHLLYKKVQIHMYTTIHVKTIQRCWYKHQSQNKKKWQNKFYNKAKYNIWLMVCTAKYIWFLWLICNEILGFNCNQFTHTNLYPELTYCVHRKLRIVLQSVLPWTYKEWTFNASPPLK